MRDLFYETSGATASWRRALKIILAFLGIFFIARVLLLVLYPDDFDGLGLRQIMQAFGRGIVFDLSIILVFIGLPLLLMMLPFRWAGSRGWQNLWGWYCYLVLSLFLFIIGADLIYFGLVHRHTGPEVTGLNNDFDLLLAMAIGDYGPALLLFLALLLPVFLLWRRVLREPRVSGVSHAVIGMVFVIMVVAVRGGVVGKPIGVVDAFNGGSSAEGYLTLNGPFSVFHSVLGSETRAVEFMAWDEAVATVQTDLLSPAERLVNEAYPLQRSMPGVPAALMNPPNVVVMMLESWDAAHVDVMRGLVGEAPLGVTPNFDALSRSGVLLSQFYAAGQRSMDGMSALLAGIPTLPGVPYLGRGMEQSGMSFLGALAQELGYASYFLQSAKRRSFRVDAISRRAGFEHYSGAEDIPATDHTAEVTERGAWDHDTLQEAHRLFGSARQPFVGFIFTASTHAPYPLPGDQWRKFKGDTIEERYLNTLFYADWALGEFFAAARRASYFQNTIFILTGDHVSGLDTRADDVRTLHHIPCLIIAPGLQPAMMDKVSSQLDILPTIVDLARWPVSYASVGRSLFDPASSATRGAFAVRGDVVSRIEQSGWVTHDLRNRIAAEHTGSVLSLDGVEHRLLAAVQVAATLLKQNRIYRPQ